MTTEFEKMLERQEVEDDVWVAADDEVLNIGRDREIDAEVYANRIQEVVKQHTANGQKLYARSYDGTVSYLYVKRMETDEEYETRVAKDKAWMKDVENSWIKHTLETAKDYGYDVVITKRAEGSGT